MAPTKPLVTQQVEACRQITGIPLRDVWIYNLLSIIFVKSNFENNKIKNKIKYSCVN